MSSMISSVERSFEGRTLFKRATTRSPRDSLGLGLGMVTWRLVEMRIIQYLPRPSRLRGMGAGARGPGGSERRELCPCPRLERGDRSR